MAKFDIVPAKTAYLIIDMTNVFLQPEAAIRVPGGLELIPGLDKLRRACREKGIMTILTTHAYRTDGCNLGIHPAFHPELAHSDITREGTPGVEFPSSLQPGPGEIVVRKARFNAFLGTDLDLILRCNGIDTLIIGGVVTNICCESTTRHARMLDYKVIFLSDGTAASDIPDRGWGKIPAADVQRYTLAIMANHFAEVASVENVVGRLSQISKVKSQNHNSKLKSD